MNMEEKLPDLPKGWLWSKLEDLARSINSGYSSGKYNRENEGIPHLRPMNISTKGKIVLSNVKYVEASNSESLLKGDVLFNNTNSPEMLGKTAIIKQNTDWAYSNHMTRIRLFQQFLEPEWVSNYLHYLFLSGYFRINCVNYVNQASISTSFLQKVPIPIAPLLVQRRIIAKTENLFSRLDIGVEALNRAESQIERYQHAVLKAAMEGKLTKDWEEAHFDISNANDFSKGSIKDGSNKSKNINVFTELSSQKLWGLPEKWLWVKLGICTKLITKGESPKWQGFDYVDKGVPFIRSENILWGNINLSNSLKIPLDFHKKLKRSIVMPNDVLINLVGASIGRCCVVPSSIQEANINQAVALIRVNSSLNPTYLMYLLISPQMQKQIHGSKAETARANISLEDLNNLNIPLPPTAEQLKIVDKIQNLLPFSDDLALKLRNGIEQTNRLRQSILMFAFEGKLVSPDLYGNNAKEILEQIKKERVGLEQSKKIVRRKKNAPKIRRNLYEVLSETDTHLKPDELFIKSGYDVVSIDDFYQELSDEIYIKLRIEQIRPNDEDVYLKVVRK